MPQITEDDISARSQEIYKKLSETLKTPFGSGTTDSMRVIHDTANRLEAGPEVIEHAIRTVARDTLTKQDAQVPVEQLLEPTNLTSQVMFQLQNYAIANDCRR